MLDKEKSVHTKGLLSLTIKARRQIAPDSLISIMGNKSSQVHHSVEVNSLPRKTNLGMQDFLMTSDNGTTNGVALIDIDAAATSNIAVPIGHVQHSSMRELVSQGLQLSIHQISTSASQLKEHVVSQQ